MKPTALAASGLAVIATLTVMLLLGPRPITVGTHATGAVSYTHLTLPTICSV